MQLAELREYSHQLALTVQRLEQAISNGQEAQEQQLYLPQPGSNPGMQWAKQLCIDDTALRYKYACKEKALPQVFWSCNCQL